MNIDMADGIVRYGGIASAIIGLFFAIWQMSSREEASDAEKARAGQLKFLGFSFGMWVLPAVLSILFIGMATPKTGVRGMGASFLAGITLVLFLSALESHKKAKKIDAGGMFSLSGFASLPLAAVGLSLLFIGIITNFYGISADAIWLSFIIGSSLGLFIIRLSSNLMEDGGSYFRLSGRLESVFILINTCVASIILCHHHFGAKKIISAYFPLFVLMALFLSTLLSTVLIPLKKGKKTMDLLPGVLAVFLTVFLGVCLFLVLRLNIKVDYNYPLIAGAITSVVFIITIYGSAAGIRGADLSAGALGALLLAGGLWFSYKWGLGLGTAIYGIGLTSIIAVLLPFSAWESALYGNPGTEGGERDELLSGVSGENIGAQADNGLWASMFMRACTLSGLTVLIFVLFRVLLQKSPALTYGVDVSQGDASMALLLGVVVSLCFEGFNLFGPNIFRPSEKACVRGGIMLFIFSLIALVAVMLSVGVLFRLEGLSAFVLGLSIPLLLGVMAFFAQKIDRGLYRASLSPLWVAGAAYSVFLVQYADVPDQLTRLHKQQIAVGMILLIIVVYFLAHYQNRGKDIKNKTVTEEISLPDKKPEASPEASDEK